MESNWEKAITFVLKWENGYVNHPNDPGGETNFGISKRSYPDLDIKNLTEEKAREIYRKDYWLPTGCQNLSWPLDIIAFDTAVNMGIGRSKAFLKATQDWVEYLFLRISTYLSFRQEIFLRGWLNRVVALYREVK